MAGCSVATESSVCRVGVRNETGMAPGEEQNHGEWHNRAAAGGAEGVPRDGEHDGAECRGQDAVAVHARPGAAARPGVAGGAGRRVARCVGRAFLVTAQDTEAEAARGWPSRCCCRCNSLVRLQTWLNSPRGRDWRGASGEFTTS